MKQRLILIALVVFLTFGIASDVLSQWVRTNGPYIGNVLSLTKQGESLFAGTDFREIYHSTDGGKVWASLESRLPDSTRVTALISNGSTLFAGTWPILAPCGGSINRSGIFRSIDNGMNWALVDSGDYMHTQINVFVTKGSTILAGTGQGIICSTDNGTTWSEVNNGLPNSKDVRGMCVHGSEVFAGDYGVYKTTDDGLTWTLTGPGIPEYFSIYSLAAQGTNVFAGTDSGIFRSTDNGGNWEAIDEGLNCRFISSLAINGSNIFAGTDSGVFLSIDNGDHWSKTITGMPTNARVLNLLLDGSILYAGTSSYGVFRSSDNGANWIANGFQSSHSNVYPGKGTDIFACANGYVFLSSDNGKSWTGRSAGLESVSGSPYVNALVFNNSYLFAGASGSGKNIFRSSDNGMTWKNVSKGLPYVSSAYLNALAATNQSLFLSYDRDSYQGGLFRSTNNGDNWEIISTGLLDSTTIEDILPLGTNLAVGTPKGVFLSSNNGAAWTPSKNGLLTNCLATNGTYLFSGTNNGVYKSVDGSSWIPGGLQGIYIVAFASTGEKVFVATASNGVFESEGNDTLWKSVNEGLYDNYNTSLTVSGSYLYAGSQSGVWRRPLSDFGISSVKEPIESDLNISLSPNPTAGITTIHNAPANILHVSVTNLLGESVIELAHPNAPEFTLDLSKLPPGTYFARFSMPNHVITRKIIRK